MKYRPNAPARSVEVSKLHGDTLRQRGAFFGRLLQAKPSRGPGNIEFTEEDLKKFKVAGSPVLLDHGDKEKSEIGKILHQFFDEKSKWLYVWGKLKDEDEIDPSLRSKLANGMSQFELGSLSAGYSAIPNERAEMDPNQRWIREVSVVDVPRFEGTHILTVNAGLNSPAEVVLQVSGQIDAMEAGDQQQQQTGEQQQSAQFDMAEFVQMKARLEQMEKQNQLLSQSYKSQKQPVVAEVLDGLKKSYGQKVPDDFKHTEEFISNLSSDPSAGIAWETIERLHGVSKSHQSKIDELTAKLNESKKELQTMKQASGQWEAQMRAARGRQQEVTEKASKRDDSPVRKKEPIDVNASARAATEEYASSINPHSFLNPETPGGQSYMAAMRALNSMGQDFWRQIPHPGIKMPYTPQ